MSCQRCHGAVPTLEAHALPCAICGKRLHSACQHFPAVAWVCLEDDCEKVVAGDRESPESQAAVASHLKSHGIRPDSPRLSKSGGSGKGSSGGWLDDIGEAVGDFLSGFLD